MAFDFKDMQDDVLDYCQDLQGETDFTLTRIKRAINRGYRAFVRATDCIPDVFSFTTVANQQYYDSSDVANWAYAYKVIGVKYIEDSGEWGRVLYPYPGGYEALPINKQYGRPTHYYILAQDGTTVSQVGTYPIVSASNETLEVRAFRYATADLSNNTDEPAMADEYRDALVHFAVWRLHAAYAHKKREWRAKGLEHRAFYQELVDSYKFNLFENDLGGEVVQDIYPDTQV